MSPETLAELFVQLSNDFVAAETVCETNEQTAEAIVGFILKRERIRRGVTDPNEVIAADRETITKMVSWDSSNPEFAVLEKVFRHLAQGRGGNAVAYLKRSIELRAEKLSQKQSQSASAPRPNRRSTVLIALDEIVQANPSIKKNEAIYELKRHTLISEVNDQRIIPKDSSIEISLSALSTQLTKARAKYRK